MISIFDDTPEDKEGYIVDMLQRGYGWKQIMKECHVSPNTISSVKKKVSGSTYDDSIIQTSKTTKESQAFRLFQQGKSLIDVKIEVDIDSSEVIEYHRRYQELRCADMYNKGYDKVKGNMTPYLHLFDLMNSLGLTPEQVQEQVKYGYELPHLQSIHKNLENQIQFLVSKQCDLDSQLQSMAQQVQQWKNSLQFYDNEIALKSNELVSLCSTINRKKSVIQRLDNNKGYVRIKEASKKETELLLQNNHHLLTDAVSASLEAIRRYPTIRELIFDLVTSDSAALYQQPWMEYHKSQLVQLSEHIYTEIAKQVTNGVVSTIETTKLESNEYVLT